jgi:hypothetical protein
MCLLTVLCRIFLREYAVLVQEWYTTFVHGETEEEGLHCVLLCPGEDSIPTKEAV